jgi:hypothetical protein
MQRFCRRLVSSSALLERVLDDDTVHGSVDAEVVGSVVRLLSACSDETETVVFCDVQFRSSRPRFASSCVLKAGRARPSQTLSARVSSARGRRGPRGPCAEPRQRAPVRGSRATASREMLGAARTSIGGRRQWSATSRSRPVAPIRISGRSQSVAPRSNDPARVAGMPARSQLRLPKAQPSWPRVLRQPGEYVAGASVRRKHGIKHVLDRPLVDNEREPLEQCHACGLQSRQVERLRQLEVLVR